jgi:hypothetical protein
VAAFCDKLSSRCFVGAIDASLLTMTTRDLGAASIAPPTGSPAKNGPGDYRELSFNAVDLFAVSAAP